MTRATHPSRLALPGVVVPAQLDYAIRGLVSLATSPAGFTKIDVIASDHGLSAKFLAQVLVTLRNAGIVRTHRGSEGGYRLARPASEITLLEVLTSVSPGLDPTETWPNGSAASSLAHDAWTRIADAYGAALGALTVADLARVAAPA